jgi:hypothetical protein
MIKEGVKEVSGGYPYPIESKEGDITLERSLSLRTEGLTRIPQKSGQM